MIEQKRDLAYQEKTERDFNRLMEAIQPVLNGEREIMDILSVEKHHMTGRVIIKFFPVPGVLGDKGRRLLEMLKHDLGYDESQSSKPETRYLDHYHNERRQHFLTNRENIVLVKSEIYEQDPNDPEKTIWSIKHLDPKKSTVQKVGEKAREAISNIFRGPWPI